MLKVAENQLELLEVSFTIQRLRVSTTMQKQCLCHQRPVLLARVTFIATRGSTAVSNFLTEYQFYIYLLVEVRTISQSPCFCNQKSVLLFYYPQSHSYYPQSHALQLEIITAIQSHYLFHLRSVLLSRFSASVTRGQY